MRTRELIVLMLTLGFLTGVALAADVPNPEATASDRTPPRLSFVDGQASFWRPGAQDWAQAQVNTPLAPGDELATASPGNLEVQIGARDFVRAWANTQVGLANQEPDFLQFTVTTGTASFDLRTIEAGRTVEVDTPHAAFTIERAGLLPRGRDRRAHGVHHPPGRPSDRDARERGGRRHRAERGGDHRGPGERARRVLRGAATRCVGPMELRADRTPPGRGERPAMCPRTRTA